MQIPETTAPLTVLNLVVFGGFGALFVQAVKVVRKLDLKQRPDSFELCASAILIALGAGVTAIYHGQIQSVYVAAQLGATAPAVVGAWFSTNPPPPGGGGGGGGGSGRHGTRAKGVRTGTGFLTGIQQALTWRMPNDIAAIRDTSSNSKASAV